MLLFPFPIPDGIALDPAPALTHKAGGVSPDPPFAFESQRTKSMNKSIAVAVALLALSSLSAPARIGETFEEVSQRYGVGQKQDCDRLPGGEKHYFVKSPYGIEVILLNGKTVMEVVHRTQGPQISEDEKKELLKVNGDNHAWSFSKRENHWMRSDHKIRAYCQPGHPDFFFIEDVAAAKQARSGGKGKLDGF
jgi:hypothetical protein